MKSKKFKKYLPVYLVIGVLLCLIGGYSFYAKRVLDSAIKNQATIVTANENLVQEEEIQPQLIPDAWKVQSTENGENFVSNEQLGLSFRSPTKWTSGGFMHDKPNAEIKEVAYASVALGPNEVIYAVSVRDFQLEEVLSELRSHWNSSEYLKSLKEEDISNFGTTGKKMTVQSTRFKNPSIVYLFQKNNYTYTFFLSLDEYPQYRREIEKIHQSVVFD